MNDGSLATESSAFAFCGRVYLPDGRVLVFLWGRVLWIEECNPPAALDHRDKFHTVCWRMALHGNIDGSPRHPLYLPSTAQLAPWEIGKW